MNQGQKGQELIDVTLTEDDLNEFLAADDADAMDAFRRKHLDWMPRGLNDSVIGRQHAAAFTHRLANDAEVMANARRVLVATLSLHALPEDCTFERLTSEGVTISEGEYWKAELTFDGLAKGYIDRVQVLERMHRENPLGFLGSDTTFDYVSLGLTFCVWSFDDMPKPKAIADALAARIATTHTAAFRTIVESDFTEHVYADSLLSELWHIALAKEQTRSIVHCEHCGRFFIPEKEHRGNPRKYCNDICKERARRIREKARKSVINS